MITICVLSIVMYTGNRLQSRCATSLAEDLATHNRELALAKGVPQFVIDYAPMVYLDKDEIYNPSDIGEQITHTTPRINYEALENLSSPLNEYNIDTLNAYGKSGRNVYLTSKVDITADPPYLFGVPPNTHFQTPNSATATIIITSHSPSVMDAYYFYFYAYNQGNTVLKHELGNHVGDWEHNMIRFIDGVPQAIWYSQHASGEVFTYRCVEKIGSRPVTYSARGSHANYAVEGTHDHVIPDLNLPFGFVKDFTSKGKLWDPVKAAYWYHFNASLDVVEAEDVEDLDGGMAASTTTNDLYGLLAAMTFSGTFSAEGTDNDSPLAIMNFRGRWGDQRYPDDDPRQEKFFGFHKYGGGPTGPWDKQLNRRNMCPRGGVAPCIVRDRLGP